MGFIAWDLSCITTSDHDVEYMTRLGLESNIETVVEERVFYYSRGIEDLKATTPILVLLHGYPQTNYMWRHVIPLLPSSVPLFVPDVPLVTVKFRLTSKLPGYGRSAPLSTPHTKRATGQAILAALANLLPKNGGPQSIILVGHDRGARIAHRLAVDVPSSPSSKFCLKGTVLLDILPATVQWETATLAGAVGFYHWAFLPNVELATSMILAFGGDTWARSCISRWQGKNIAGTLKIQEHDALKVYGDSFRFEHVIRASCDDYRASAEEEVKEHEDDQKEGRKMDGDVLVLYSTAFAATRGDIKVWREWMGRGELDMKGFGDGVGHFIAEEAAEATANAMAAFYTTHE